MHHHAMLLIIHWLLYVDYLKLYTYNSDTAAGAELIAPTGGALKNFANFTGKHLCWSLLFTKLQAFRVATLIKKTPTQVLSCEIWEILKNTYFGNSWTAASVYWLLHHILIFTVLYSTCFSFFLYYAIKTIELMKRQSVSSEEVFHWMKVLAFES